MTTSAHVVLDDGRRLTVRPIRPGDRDGLMAMHRRLSTTTVHRRFFVLLPELDPSRAEHFTNVDGRDRAALVAENDIGELVAVARYDRLPGTQDAEVAIVVQDAYQHHRVGTALLTRLTQYARAHGIERFIADVLTENSPMFATFRDAGLLGTTRYEAGVAHLVLPLPASGAHRSAGSSAGPHPAQ